MDSSGLLAVYDSQLREEAEVARAESVHRQGPLLWARFGDQGMVTYRSLGGADGAALDELIRQTLAYFLDSTEVASVEWKTRGHDRPPDLGQHLLAHGFTPEEVETVMIGEAAALAVAVEVPAGLAVRRAGDGNDLRDDVRRASAVQSRVFAGLAGRDADRVAGQLAADPEHLQLWLAEVGGQVVGAGSLDVVRGTQFAGLWGGAVVPEWRGRGVYRALTAARARAALARGATYLHSDCSAMSRPILERSGLRPVTTTTPYVCTRDICTRTTAAGTTAGPA
jgi:hypothetical protein